MEKWFDKNTESLIGKTVAITGTTGGIGRELCQYLAQLGASLILLDRNKQRSESFKNELLNSFPESNVECLTIDLEDFETVKSACERLKTKNIDLFIHNAGAYSIPRCTCSTGYDNVFQINFVSPYYMIRELEVEKTIVVGSIAHNYSKIDPNDIDFSTRKASSKVYGNSKRFLMFSLYELFKNDSKFLSITHPGITFTNITNHYPKLIFALIKHPMKIIFMKPKKAALSILKGVFDPCSYHEWIGPRAFDVWGLPTKKKLKTCSTNESQQIGKIADEIYKKLRQ